MRARIRAPEATDRLSGCARERRDNGRCRATVRRREPPRALADAAREAHIRIVADKQDIARERAAQRWTRIDPYLRSIRRRRGLSARPHHDPERPRALLNTLPFVALAFGLALMTVIIVSLAWPGRSRDHAPLKAQAEQPEPGTAPPGWIDG